MLISTYSYKIKRINKLRAYDSGLNCHKRESILIVPYLKEHMFYGAITVVEHYIS